MTLLSLADTSSDPVALYMKIKVREEEKENLRKELKDKENI